MARIKSKRSALQTLSCEFGGMGKHTSLSVKGADDMCNFRILPNGVLKVRSGYTRIKSFPSGKKIRGVWDGVLNDTSLFFSVVGDTVYRLEGAEMVEITAGIITDDEAPVHFCVYENSLYLLDGVKIWIYSPASSKFTEVEPYVPLYGYQWHPESYGEIHEEINLISPRLRVHYYNSTDTNVFMLPFFAESLDAVYINGRKTTDYVFSKGSLQVIFPSAPITVEIGFTLARDEELRDKILAAQMSFIYARNGENKLFLWGNDGRLFCSRKATSTMMSSCHVFYPKASSLYFCADDVFFLGDSLHPITGICPLYETLLLFTSDRIWNLYFDKDGILQATLATHDMGCASPHGVIPYENGALIAINGCIFHLTASSARTEDLFFERVSAGIDDKFPVGFTDRVHLERNFFDGEILMRDPTDATGTVWVWNTENKEWYRFNRINATFFLKSAGKLGFVDGSDIFFFEHGASTDNGAPIDAYYKSAYLDLGAPDSIKRAMRALLYASPGKSSSQILFETEQGEISYRLTTPSRARTPQLYDMRMHTHRYRFLRFTLSTAASHPTEFYRLDIYSKP